MRYRTTDANYKVENFLNPTTGAKYFRSIKLLKSTYSEDDIRIGMAFEGATGIFRELPKSSNMEDFDYTQIFDHSYFLEK